MHLYAIGAYLSFARTLSEFAKVDPPEEALLIVLRVGNQLRPS